MCSSDLNAGVTAEAMFNMAKGAAEQWIEILGGAVPPRLVNPAAWPKYCERFQAIAGFRPPALS